MKRSIFKHSLLVGVAIFTIATIVPLTVRAQQAQLPVESRQETIQERKETVQAKVNEQVESAKTKLADAKLKACQNREKNITNIISRIRDRSRKQLEVFTKISDRTQTFYAESGNTLREYDSLVASVNSTKNAAQIAVAKVNDNSSSFTCDGADPRGVANSFKANLDNQNTALKAYKTAIKNLIVGVKSVQTSTTGDNQ